MPSGRPVQAARPTPYSVVLIRAHTRWRGHDDQLVEDARPTLAVEKAPWGNHFGRCTDRYGIGWMVNFSGS